ncbi:MAG TPA: SDR family oxidoreductase [Candidatus Dormibacteraeota bacterium]|nr:SDR family oxidoreductase [Candidatus Dormibacteraeota bacterium]
MILVTGATGLNGKELVRRLSARGVPLRALVRNAAKAADLSALPNVEIVPGDMARPETLAGPLRGVERAVLISSSDPAMLEVQSNFIAAAARAGVRHVVKLSGIMPELDSPFRFARMHGEIERRLEASGMAFTHLRAGEFMPAYFRQVPSIVTKGALFLPMEDAKIASIDIGDIAEVAATVLTGSGHEGKIYPLTGPEALSMAEVADKLSAATGKQIRYVNVAPDDAKKAQLAAGVPPYLAEALAELFAERRRGKEAQVSPVAQTILGRRPTSFAEFALRNAAIFRGEQPAPRL